MQNDTEENDAQENDAQEVKFENGKERFILLDVRNHEPLAYLELDLGLMTKEAEILNHETMLLGGLTNGKWYTLMPMEDHRLAVLQRLQKVYSDIQKPMTGSFHQVFSRMDALKEAVGALFGDISYCQVTTKEQLQWLVRPTTDESQKPPEIKQNLLGDLLDEINADAEAKRSETISRLDEILNPNEKSDDSDE